MNSCIIMAADTERTGCKHLTVFDVCLSTFLIQYVKQYAVLCLARYDHHILEVLGTCTDERDTTYVNLLNNIIGRRTTGNRLFKRLEVDNHQVNGRYLIFAHLGYIAFISTTCKDTSEYFRMKCLHTTSKN